MRVKLPPYISGSSSDGYIYGVPTTTNSKDAFLIKYNNILSINDTISVVYGNHNVNVYRNNQLIYNKEDISQTTEIHFDIIK